MRSTERQERRSPREAGSEAVQKCLGGHRNSSEASRRRPPFGVEIEAALARGESPNVRIFTGPDAWARATTYRDWRGPCTALVLPVDTNPEAIRWPPLRDLIADVTRLPGDQVAALARALVRDGCRLAYLLDAECPERNVRVIRRRAGS